MPRHSVVGHRADDDAVVEQALVDGHGLPGRADVEGEEVAQRRNPVQFERLEAGLHLRHAGDVQAAALLRVGAILDRRLGSGQRQRVGVEGLAHPVHQIGEERRTDRVADAQRRQAVDLREGAGDDEIRVAFDETNAVRIAGRRNVLRIGFVEHHPDVRRHAIEQSAQRSFVHPGAGGVVRIADEDDPGALVDGRREAVQIVAPGLGRHAHHLAAGRGNRQRIDHEAVFVDDAPAARRDGHPGGQVEHVVGAVAEGQLLRRHAEMGGQRVLQAKAAAVGIAGKRLSRVRQRPLHRRPRPARILVAGQLDGIVDAALPGQFLDRFAGLVRGQRRHLGVDVAEGGHVVARG